MVAAAGEVGGTFPVSPSGDAAGDDDVADDDANS